MEELSVLRWIPLVPLLGTAINIFFGPSLGRKNAGILACSAVAVSFLLSLGVFSALSSAGALKDTVFTWIESEPLRIELSFQADRLTAVMLFVITGIGFLIHVYSLGYMGHDEGMIRYFAYLNLFIFFMTLLVLADNLLLLFVGWEGVGLCSYLLIGFWYHDHTNTIAGNKAFVVNRIGDLGFLLGILLLFSELARLGVPAVDFAGLQRSVDLVSREKITLITLLLFAGATGKSAQIPLYVWLPDAMQGPTPVSALIHAATMVTAGIYMTARLHFLFALAPLTLAVIAAIGALTAFLAATIGLAQNDIKRVLAYSTVSQLGYMFLAVGVGAFSAAIFHLFTHAFFKACLFLSAGNVIHGLHGEQDMRKMGGLKSFFPVTYWAYLIAALAISGAPLTAGFFSKDQILWSAFSRGWFSLWLVALITAGLTALYMFRQFFMVFHGPRRLEQETPHEAPSVMTVPVMLLGLGSIFAGWLWTPEFFWGSAWSGWLDPFFGVKEGVPHAALREEIFLMALTVAVAGAGLALAYAHFRGTRLSVVVSSWPVYRLLSNKYYVDEIYDTALVRPFTSASAWFASFFDPVVIDGIVNGVANRVRESSLVWRRIQTGNVQHYLFAFLAGTLLLLAYYLGQ